MNKKEARDAHQVSNITTRLLSSLDLKLGTIQCGQIKIAKCLSKLPKNDFIKKMNDFGTFTKNA